MEITFLQKTEVYDHRGPYDVKRLTGETEVSIKYDFSKDIEFDKELRSLIAKYFKDNEGNEKLCR